MAELGFLVAAAKQNSLWKNVKPPPVLGHEASYSPKGKSRGSRSRPASGPGEGPPWHFFVPSSRSVGLRVKYEYWGIFWDFS